MKSRIEKIIKETIQKVLFEHQNDVPFFDEGDDITSAVMQYLKYSQYGEKNAMFSIEANKLHTSLMSSISLNPDNQEDRKKFSMILYYIRVLLKHKWNFTIKVGEYNNEWEIKINNFKDMLGQPLEIGTNEIETTEEGYKTQIFSPFEDRKGIETSGYEYRGNGLCNAYGYYTKAILTDEMQQKIRSMGLVPCLFVTGSYHENFFYAVGVIPEFVNKVEHAERYEHGYHFDCIFDEKQSHK